MSEPTTRAQHKHSSKHRDEILRSTLCGCFYCERTYPPTEIVEWVDKFSGQGIGTTGQTALCPYCHIDSVIGNAEIDITSELLATMYREWFGTPIPAEEVRKRLGKK